MPSITTLSTQPTRRRDLQKEETRLDLAFAAFELAETNGLANVRIPQIAAAVGVSPRTFNNYFASKEAAIVWPFTLRSDRLVTGLAGRPTDEPLADALVAAVMGLYGHSEADGLPKGWLTRFRALVAAEPALQGEYLKVAAAAETALAAGIAARAGVESGELAPQVLAAVVAGAERVAVRHWARRMRPSAPLADLVRSALSMALAGIDLTNPGLSISHDHNGTKEIR
jgi:AcrR family transcriptional regulator